ncbi:ABC transporter substrate-binding protein [Limibacillus halophilus]|uniref:Branched-chain amino acid transport system substrate-binding protein n=1 Tax=Limibacillus halophilus TaxID=1579333 RepID=A0A839SZG7_9PROT|nr:ABC transporter substrate-binding protein [Limibacillus halophilus]MBB3066994.1 branched-chain amino acid transport system substrate-binding protein [Limibacillus halophilus]
MQYKFTRRNALKVAGASLIGAAGLNMPFIGNSALASSGTLNLTVINSLSGRFARYGAELKRGIDLAIAAVNQAGIPVGDATLQINLTEYDDKTDATLCARLVEKAISSDGADLVIAGVGSVNVKTVIPVAQRFRFPVIALWAQVDGVFAGQKGDPYVFGPMPPFSLYYTKILEMASKMENPSIKKVGIITPQDELGVFTVNDYVPSDIEKAGLDLVAAEYFPPNSQEFSGALDRVRRAEPDALIINCYTPDIISIFKEMQAIGYFPPMVIVEAPTSLADALGSDLEGVFAPTFWDPTLDRTKDDVVGTSRDFAAAYEAAHGQIPPDFVAAAGANTIATAVAAFRDAKGSTDAADLRQAFIGMDSETFFSTVRFADDGLNQGGTVYPSQFQGGVPKLVYPPEFATADPIHPLPAHSKS